jgi:hypothetical protein
MKPPGSGRGSRPSILKMKESSLGCPGFARDVRCSADSRTSSISSASSICNRPHGAVFLHEKAAPTYERVERRIAYAVGLLAIHREIELPAKASKTITLYLFDVEGQEPSQVLASVTR